MLCVIIGISEYLHNTLIERVVETFANGDGKPCVATLYLTLDANGFRLLSESLLLGSVFHLKEYALLLQQLY